MSRERSQGTPPLAGLSDAGRSLPSSNLAGPSSSLSTAAQKVHDLVQQVRRNPRDASIFSELIPAALDYVQKGNGKLTHPFCPKGGAPDLELHTCMIRVLSFKSGKEIEEWLQMLGKNLYQCSDCYKRYVLAKDGLRSR